MLEEVAAFPGHTFESRRKKAAADAAESRRRPCPQRLLLSPRLSLPFPFDADVGLEAKYKAKACRQLSSISRMAYGPLNTAKSDS